MKKNLFLFLLLLVCAGRASADGIGANCGNATPLRTNGQFQAIACDVLGLGTAILIDGPAGLETFVVGSDFVDGFLSFYLNARGEVVASWQATGTDATFVLAYTGPDVQNRGAMTLGCDMCGPDVLPGTTIRTNFAYLTLALGPVFNNTSPPDKPIYDQISTYILATGITDHGIVEANETYSYNAHAPVTIPATWDFDRPRTLHPDAAHPGLTSVGGSQAEEGYCLDIQSRRSDDVG